jgi:WhiB family redox-sensing transcriptional regulator
MRYPIPADARTPCRRGDPDRFWPTHGVNRSEIQPVIEECRKCPLVDDCRDWALYHEPDGLWGATTPNERRSMRKRLGITCVTPYMSVDYHPRNDMRRHADHQADYTAQHRPGRAS